MSKGVQVSLIVVASVVAVAALLLVGIYLGRVSVFTDAAWLGEAARGPAVQLQAWPGGRMGNYRMMDFGIPAGFWPHRMMGAQASGSYGMMGTQASGSFGMMSGGMMGDFSGGSLLGGEPLSIDQARTAVADFLGAIESEGLTIGEVMIFSNHAYVQVLESETGIGAFELLVDPVTLAVFPEHGPNMMWNLKYGMMGRSGMQGMPNAYQSSGRLGGYLGGGMMGGYGGQTPGNQRSEVDDWDPSTQPIGPEQAIRIAQEYLEKYLPGAEADSKADAFYGYHTIHILRDGDTVGMLSVNAFSGQVWVHSWHAELIEQSGHD